MRVWLGYAGGPRFSDPERSDGVPPLVPNDLAPHYDLTLSLADAGHPVCAAFRRYLAEAAAAHGLSCAEFHDATVSEAVRRIDDGRLTVGLHLDCRARWDRPEDAYARLAQAVADAGGCPVNASARARLFTDRAAAHPELISRGLGVPETVVVRPWTPDRPLTAAERARLRLDEPGARLRIKPASGCRGGEVVHVAHTDPDGVAAAVAAARRDERQESYLLQREVRSPRLEGADCVARPASWRVLYCLGELIPCWWSRSADTEGPGGRLVTREEIRCHRLRPVLAYAAALARMTGLQWFSTDLCLTDAPVPSRHRVPADGRDWAVVAVNPVEVPGHGPGELPDEVVRHIADRFAEAAWLWRHTRVVSEEAEPRRPAA
jgi:hypothetical protein